MQQERKRVKPDKGEWPYVMLGIFLFFGSIFLFIIEIGNYTYTTNFNTFIIIYGILGLLLAIVLSAYYGKGTRGVERAKLTLLFVIFVSMIVPVWSHFFNRMIPIHSHSTKVEIFQNELQAYLATNPSIDMSAIEKYDLFLVYKKRILKLTTYNLAYANLPAGDSLEIVIRRGIFGFEFVDKQMFQ